MRVKTIVMASVNGLLLILILISYIIYSNLGGLLQSQKAGERFRGDSEERFAQISSFFPSGSGFRAFDVEEFHRSLDSKLTEASISVPENGSLFIDAYSMKSQLTVRNEKSSVTSANSVNATAIGIGGDYFEFHPLELRSGSYIRGGDLMRDRVMLDEELAWQLFGSSDIAGMEVTINSEPYIIAGVVSREKDYASKKALDFYLGDSKASIYVCYEVIASYEDALFDCYEAVLPEPISGFAEGLVKGSTLAPSNAELIKNTGRFGLFATFETIGGFGERSMHIAPISYPYWENAARVNEDYMALLMVLMLMFAVFPLLTLFILIAWFMRMTKGKGRVILDKYDDFKEWLRAFMRRIRKSSREKTGARR